MRTEALTLNPECSHERRSLIRCDWWLKDEGRASVPGSPPLCVIRAWERKLALKPEHAEAPKDIEKARALQQRLKDIR